ncbi:MAG: phosphoglycerate kinase [Patescibacteria group bacterium]|nr:phosphoglycerate kinase [Patescibacteria group bacterium]
MIRFLRTAKKSELKDRIALLRLDFNTEDNWRMDASLQTIRFLLGKSRSVVILTHKGRPDGFEQRLSLRPVAKTLARKLKKKVVFIPHFRFRDIADLVRSAPKGSVFLLENLRFLDGEEANSPVLAEHLASVGDFYVNDAFAVSHRANASVDALPRRMPRYAGLELEAEMKNLTRAMHSPRKPLMVILGGLKIEDKLTVYQNLKRKASLFLLGGALTDDVMRTLAKPKLMLPVDFRRDETGAVRDIGPKTEKVFCAELRRAKTILWNGPLGNIDDIRFRRGTKAIASCVAKSKGFTIAGGGETVMFLKKLKLDKKISFISTGGGAMLDFLAGKKMPGIEALK